MIGGKNEELVSKYNMRTPFHSRVVDSGWSGGANVLEAVMAIRCNYGIFGRYSER